MFSHALRLFSTRPTVQRKYTSAKVIYNSCMYLRAFRQENQQNQQRGSTQIHDKSLDFSAGKSVDRSNCFFPASVASVASREASKWRVLSRGRKARVLENFDAATAPEFRMEVHN